MVNEGQKEFNYYFPYTDHLGSILTVTNAKGDIIAEQNFDAWGRKRNADSWDYQDVNDVPSWLYRGFTGHEHLPEFGLINMNARLYDPVLGRMLSPDNYVGEGTQGFNRYSYANNNPLNTIDPDGNNPIILVGAVVGGLMNLGIKAYNGQINSLEDGIFAFGIGALGGAITAATGGAAASYFGLGTTGIASGLVTGGVGAAFGSPITGVGNSLYFNDPSYSFEQYGKDILTSAALGGIISGGVAAFKGQNLWWGNTPLATRVATEMTKQSLSWSQRGYVEEISKAELADLARRGIKPSINLAGGVQLETTSSTWTFSVTFGKNAKGHLIKHANVLGYDDPTLNLQKMLPELKQKTLSLFQQADPSLIKMGQWHHHSNAFMFISDGKMLVTEANGTFITMINKTSNQWYNSAKFINR